MDIQFIDWRGYPINIGDKVLYPSLVGRTAQMTEGEVLDIYRVQYDHDKNKWVRTNRPPTPKVDNINHMDKVFWRIRIQPTSDSMNSVRGGWKQEPPKPVVILNTENVTQISGTVLMFS